MESTNRDKSQVQPSIESTTIFHQTGILNSLPDLAWSQVRGSSVKLRSKDSTWTECQVDGSSFVARFPGLFLYGAFGLRIFSYFAVPYYLSMAHLNLDPNQVWLNGELQPFSQPLSDSQVKDLRESVMQVVGGDGSPRSYLAAVLLFRALGRRWSMDEVIISNPQELAAAVFKEKTDPHSSSKPISAIVQLLRAGWRWKTGSLFQTWKPSVAVRDGIVTVHVCSLSFEGEIALSRHSYTFEQGRYSILNHQAHPLATSGCVSIVDS